MNLKKCLIISLIILLIILFLKIKNNYKSDSNQSIFNQGGYILSFDDNYIHNWYKISSLLDKYKCKATFFVSGFGYLDNESINILLELQNKGHEIALHTLNHKSAIKYLLKSDLNNYIQYEINPELDSMNFYGFNPKTFSYPYGDNNVMMDSVLLEKFELLRDVTNSQRHFYSMFFKEYDQLDEIFITNKSSNVIKGLGIDKNYNVSINDINKIFNRLSKNNEMVIFYCHNPVKKAYKKFQIEIDYLENFLILANEYNLKSYRFMDLISN